MVGRLTAAVPRFVLLPMLALLGTTTLTFAADTQLSGSPPATTPASAPQTELVVPDVRRQAYVFAKGTLEDAGLAWRVGGSVRGYAANLVARQIPAPGTRVVDTGAPTVVLTLARNPKYPERGTPEDAAPFRGTEIEIVRPAQPAATAAPEPAAKPHAKAKKPAAKPQAKAKKPTVKKRAAKPSAAKTRLPAFAVPGAPKEPLDEMTLPDRAAALDRWLTRDRRPTSANVRHWLYQHQWIVTGARFGWWHGDQALERLLAVDRRVRLQWGIGARSERSARAALAFVKARS